MTPEQERWAEALAVLRLHGDAAFDFAAARIAALTKIGDMAGVGRWREIAARLDGLRAARLQTH